MDEGRMQRMFSRLDVQYSLDGSEAVFPSLSLLCWLAELQYVPYVYREYGDELELMMLSLCCDTRYSVGF